MRRAWVLLLALPLLAACGSREPVTFPTDRVELVAGYTLGGGMLPASYYAIQAPVLLVYSDGRVVSGASRTMTIGSEELGDLVGDLRDYLEDLGDVESAEARQIMDAPGTTLMVRSADGSLTKVSATALGIVNDYPRALTRSYDLLSDLAKRADTTGSPYTSDSILLVLERRDNPTEPVRPWPASIDLPGTNSIGVRSADLSGAAAADVVTALGPRSGGAARGRCTACPMAARGAPSGGTVPPVRTTSNELADWVTGRPGRGIFSSVAWRARATR